MGISMSPDESVPGLPEVDRVRRVREELENRIDADLRLAKSAKRLEVDFHTLDRYAAYLSYRAAENYRRAAISLSIVVAGATVINVLVAVRLF